MKFNKHSNLEGQHAFLSGSKYYWLNYDNEKMVEAWNNWMAVQKGTELHDFARHCIELGITLPRNKKTLNAYVNDAIGYKMTPEQPLYYSDNCFGTADAISFRKNYLRIHDLKTGVTPASLNQERIYAALFCLEYNIKPEEITIEIRIYQNDDVVVEICDTEMIKAIMQKIIDADKLINKLRGDIEE